MSRIFKSYESSAADVEKKIITLKHIELQKEVDDEFDGTLSKEKYDAIIKNAQNEALAIVNRAHEEARLIKEQINNEQQSWQSEKEALIAEAEQYGFSVGEAAGKKAGYEEVKEKITEAQEVVALSKVQYEEKISSAQAVILQLGLKVAEKIIGKTIEDDESNFLSIVETVLKEAREDKEVQIHINPIYYEMLISEKDELVNIFPTEVALTIYPDDELDQSKCFIETENGRIDASIDSQLVEIKQKLFELLESEQ